MPSNNKIMRDNSSGRCQSHDQTNENRHPNARQSRNLPPNETKNSQSVPSILSSNGKEHTPKSYKLGVQLGSGSFASVYLAREWPSNRKVAVKLIHFQGNATRAGGREETRYDSGGRETTVLEMIQCEIDIHKSLSSTSLCGTQQQLQPQPQPQYPQHPNIVQFYNSFQLDKECFQTMIATTATNAPARLHYALVMEYCPGGDLSSYLKRIRDERRHDNVAVPTGESSQWDDRKSTLLTEREIRHALSEVLAGLSFLHSRGIIHRDIKASNIFLSPTTSARTDNNVDFRPNHHGMRHPSLAKTQNNEGLNLLQYRLKIGDFGLSVQLRDDDDWYEAQRTLCGTPSCIAPEVVMAASSTSPYAESLCMENCGNFGGVDRVGVGEAPNPSCCGIDDSVFPSFDGDTDTVLILARHEKSSRRHQRGSRKYDPTNNPHNGRNAQNGGVTGYGQPADLWSTGCLLYTMIVGKNPFACPIRQNVSNPQKQINPSVDANEEKAERIRQTIQRILRLDWSVPSHLCMSSQLESLLHQLLSKDPKMRGSARSILSFHPFFNTEKENAQPLRELDTDVLLAKTSTVKTTHASNSIKEGGSMGAKGTEKYQQPAPNHGNSDVNILPTNRNDSISSKSASLSAKSSRSNKVSNDLHEGNMNKISPMKGLQRLPASKYTITERTKTTAIYSRFDSAIDRKRCKVFFLGKHGLVIQHEHDGDWMHVTSDGLYFIAGKMTLNSVMHDNGAIIDRQSHYEDHTALLNEAFLHAPSDLFPSTTRSMYRPISFISHANNSRFLPLYRMLENAVQSMKSSTPMITIYLHTSNSPGPGNDHTYRLFAKSTMMENYPIPDIEIAFVDGTTIRFRMSTGDVSIAVKPIDMRISKEMKLEARIDPNLMHPFSVVTSDSFSSCILDSNRMMHDYLRHLNMMRAAAWECFDIIERSSAGERDSFPIVRKLVANCSQRDKWQIIKSY